MKELLLNLSKMPFQIFLFITLLTFSNNSVFAENNNCGVLESIEFTNGDSIQEINNNDTYSLNDLPNNFYVNVNYDGRVRSVRYNVKNLDTNQEYSIIENIKPFTFPAGNSPWNLGEGNFSVKVKLYKYRFGLGQVCDQQTFLFSINSEECTADAGSLHIDADPVILTNGSAIISASHGDAPVIPEGYSFIYVLTSGDDLVIEDVNPESPSFTVDMAGLYTIHTLVYDGNEDSANYLNLGVVDFGTTTGGDVLGIVGAAGLCAALDVAGAPVMVNECTADAGSLHIDADPVILTNGSAMISASHGDAPVIPEGYSFIYVLTSGDDLVIEDVNPESPSFTVDMAGLYTIHTLVYDGNEDSANYLNLGVVDFGTTTGGDVLGIVGAAGLCAALDVAGAPVMVNECTADAGSLHIDADPVILTNGSAMISASHGDAPVIPEGYSFIYVLTSGDDLVIEDVNPESPSFTVDMAGLYTIHTLVYDGNEDSANYLNLGVVDFGTTTGGDVLGIVGAAGLCAALDVAGAPVMVNECTADAGSLHIDADPVILTNGSAMISASHGDAPVIPEGYSFIYVLTSGDDLVIEDVNPESPSFTVDMAGLYTIHTLVYDGNEDSANYLNLGVVDFGTTTGGDVLGIVGAAGLCAALDVAGAPVMVNECTADAGSLHIDADPVILTNGSAMISASHGDAPVIPEGYSFIYVLTSGDDLVIEDVNPESPSFTVDMAGLYTIHTLVYDGNEDSANYLNLGVVDFGTTTGGDVLGIVGAAGLCAALDVAGAPVMVNECTADAGSLHIDADPVILTNGSAMISASHGDAPVIPEGYSFIYVLTSGDDLVIEDVNPESPSFTIDMAGLYTIHTLVYDGNEDSANYLNLGVVDFGTTTGGDVLGIVGAAGLCAALDVAGAPVMVEAGESCDAYAGTLKSNNIISCLSGGSSTIIAYENNAPVIPEGYEQLFVLTNAFDLTILDVDSSPEFEVDHVGFYRIHSLVYNPETLDLGIVQIGQTTGFDVNGLLQQGGGDICASLDVQGAVFLVLPSWICSWFNYSYNARVGDQSSIVEGYISQFDNYKAFERSILKDNEPRLYPNPVNDILNVDIKLFDNETMFYTISDLGGRTIQSGSINEITTLGNTIETNRLSSGTYLVNFTSDYRNFVKKIQVSK